MENADDVIDGVFVPPRKALADLSNGTGKRPFSLISGKSKDGNENNDNGDSQFAKQVCLGVENLVRQKCNATLCLNRNDKVVSSQNPRDGIGFCATTNPPSGYSTIDNDTLRDKYDLFDPTARTVTNIADDAMKDGQESRDPSASSVSMPSFAELVNTGAKSPFGGTSVLSQHTDRPLSKGLVTITDGNNGGDQNLGKWVTSGSGAIGWSQHLGSQASKFPVLERCTGLKTEGNADELHGGNLLGFCSCSFCLKAAHIWMDLHYQDIRGRITAMKKSQKEANAMVLKMSRGMDALKNCQKNSKEYSDLEFDLMDQWRSLFLHMEKVLAHESNQLEGSSHTLKDLRDNCKMDLEMINK